MAEDPASTPVAVVGVSLASSCGVRDHATLLARGLDESGVACELHWLTRSQRSLRGSREEIGAWAAGVGRELAAAGPPAVLLHYSVFTVSHKGVPLFLRPVLAAARAARAPVAGVLHEFAYPWGYGGWRGGVWAVSQRAALVELVRSCDALMVTAEQRARWLRSRRWLPARPVVSAPVFSNLPAPAPAARDSRPAQLGLFGFSYQGAAVELVLDALAEVRAARAGTRLLLLGAPGPDSPAGREWAHAASARGLAEAVDFSGRLPAQELSDTLARCEVLLFPDAAGPSSRKGTLAAALASGSPVLALDGPAAWPALVRAGAVALSPPTAAALARELLRLLGDEAARRRLGAAGSEFCGREMSLARSVAAARDLLAAAGAGPAAQAAPTAAAPTEP